MKYSVDIRDNATGEVRRVPQSLPWGKGSGSLYWWTEGNFGCDCNRSHVFATKEESEADGFSDECGKTRFTVIKALFEDGSETQVDGNDSWLYAVHDDNMKADCTISITGELK